MAEADGQGKTSERRGETHSDTFEILLGEGWETSGDGIYRRVEIGEQPRPANHLVDALESSHPSGPSVNEVR